MKRAQKRLLVKVQASCRRKPQHFGATSNMQGPRTEAAVQWSQLESEDKLCVLQGAELEKRSGFLEEPRLRVEYRYWTLSY